MGAPDGVGNRPPAREDKQGVEAVASGQEAGIKRTGAPQAGRKPAVRSGRYTHGGPGHGGEPSGAGTPEDG
jgi:hypothetical protein